MEVKSCFPKWPPRIPKVGFLVAVRLGRKSSSPHGASSLACCGGGGDPSCPLTFSDAMWYNRRKAHFSLSSQPWWQGWEWYQYLEVLGDIRMLLPLSLAGDTAGFYWGFLDLSLNLELRYLQLGNTNRLRSKKQKGNQETHSCDSKDPSWSAFFLPM